MQENITNNFNEQVYEAVEKKAAWFDGTFLPSLVPQYRIMETCEKTITEYLVKKSLIQDDPYKLDKKISDVAPIEAGEYLEAEKEMTLGLRLSDYDNMLNFICNYYKLCIANLGLEKLKVFGAINSCFLWNDCSTACEHTNTRLLANVLAVFKQTADPVTVGIVSDYIARAGKALTCIEDMFKQITDFQKQAFKAKVRKYVMQSPKYCVLCPKDRNSCFDAVKKCFSECMIDSPFYVDLIQEILEEDYGGQRDEKRAKLLKALSIQDEQEKKKQKAVDTKQMIVQAVLILAGLSGTLLQFVQKIQDNHNVLEEQKNGFWQKFSCFIRKIFGLKEPACIYEIVIIDSRTATKKIQRIEYQHFLSLLQNKSRFFDAFSTKDSSGTKKLQAMEEKKICDFLLEQLSFSNHLYLQLAALNEFFKTAVSSSQKSKMKGMQMELTLYKNTVSKARQKKSDYTQIVDEQAQMKKLGII